MGEYFMLPSRNENLTFAIYRMSSAKYLMFFSHTSRTKGQAFFFINFISRRLSHTSVNAYIYIQMAPHARYLDSFCSFSFKRNRGIAPRRSRRVPLAPSRTFLHLLFPLHRNVKSRRYDSPRNGPYTARSPLLVSPGRPAGRPIDRSIGPPIDV